MAKMRGVDILLFVDTGAGTPTWTVVGGQRNATLHEEVDTVEMSSKESTAKEFEYGLGTWTISCDGVYIDSDTAYAELRDAVRNRQKVKVRIKEGATYTAEGDALVTSADLEAPYDGEATYSMELQGTGPLTPNPTP